MKDCACKEIEFGTVSEVLSRGFDYNKYCENENGSIDTKTLQLVCYWKQKNNYNQA